jgi:hypothetical protein
VQYVSGCDKYCGKDYSYENHVCTHDDGILTRLNSLVTKSF